MYKVFGYSVYNIFFQMFLDMNFTEKYRYFDRHRFIIIFKLNLYFQIFTEKSVATNKVCIIVFFHTKLMR